MVDEARRYKVLEVLGQGGFGTVYRAEMMSAGGFRKQVAIKVLHTDAELPEEVLQRLRDEARILGLLRHRAVVGVDGLALLDGGWAVVMEYVPGVDLTAVLREGPMPPRAALEILEEVASLLHTAWNTPSGESGEPLRLIHRDLKPSNIRLTAQGEVKVLDFGVARADFSDREAHTSSYVYGSMKYMPVERLEGVEGPTGDIYALGILLLELLAGRELPDPPRHPDRFAEWHRAARDHALAGIHLSEPGTPATAAQALLDLSRAMAHFEVSQRLDAEQVKARCGHLRHVLVGAWLKDWTEAHVPHLEQASRSATHDGTSGSILVERSQALARPSRTAARPRGTPTGRLPARVGLFLALPLVLSLAVLYWVFASPDGPLRPPDAPATPAEATAPLPSSDAPPSVADLSRVIPTPEDLAPAATPDPATTKPPLAPVARTLPTPRAVAAPTPPDPVPPAPAAASVEVSGDARTVRLVSGGIVADPTNVPPGTWTVQAAFGEGEPVNAGTVTVGASERVRIRCVSAMLRCSRAP